MNKKLNCVGSNFSFLAMILSVSSPVLAGSNFTIRPSATATFPSSIYPGQTVSAYYIVTNQTSTSRSGYELKGLPSSVSQNINGGTCSAPLSLAAFASCTLRLDITAAVQTLFAFCKGNSCTSASTPLSLSYNNTLPMVAAGTYTNTLSRTVPLLVTSINGGMSWVYSIFTNTPTFPSNLSSGNFKGASCSGVNCIASGDYVTAFGRFPLIAASTDGGGSWLYTLTATSPVLPSDYRTSGTFPSASCSGTNCVSVGSYADTSFTNFPFITTSTDGGGSWTYTVSSTTPSLPSDFSNGSFNSGSCSGVYCVAGGKYQSTSFVQYPLLASSQNGGLSWSYLIDSTSPTLPTDYSDSGNFSSVSCSGTNCVAGGSYTSTSSQPLVASSSDGGVSWTYTISESDTPPNYLSDGVFNSVSCSGQLCIAGGNYTPTVGVQSLMLATSTDGGANWVYTIDSATLLPSNYRTGTINSVSCSAGHCIAAGQYSNVSSVQFPFIATSSDGGNTWTYPVDSAGTLPSDYVRQGVFNSASCNGLICIAAGSYRNSIGVFPMLATSLNGGLSWTYSIQSTTPALPADYLSSGTFSSASANLSTVLG